MRYWLALLDWWHGKPYGGLRSSHWPSVRNAFIKTRPLCEVCGEKNPEAHHVQPFHLYPELELLPQNLIALCRPHHLLYGHYMSWKSFNDKVREDALIWNTRIKNRPVDNPLEVE
jgi:hypothetical protein